MPVDAWNPTQYERFAAERRQPFDDLVSLIRPLDGGRAVDLGCGPGSLTAELPALVGAREVFGIDSSPAMLAEAAGHAGPQVRFAEGDLASFEDPGAWDLVLANAALHWAPDHAAVLARWSSSLRPGGQLAVQIPANAGHPSHLVATSVAEEEPFASALGGTPPPDVVTANVLAPERYAVLLDQLGFAEQHVRLQVYGHHLASTAEVVEWVKGTTLTRFQQAMAPALFDEFLSRYRERLLAELGDHSPYFYPFKRILFWGKR
jgi:trans-aconitate 2-methyltransferase